MEARAGRGGAAVPQFPPCVQPAQGGWVSEVKEPFRLPTGDRATNSRCRTPDAEPATPFRFGVWEESGGPLRRPARASLRRTGNRRQKNTVIKQKMFSKKTCHLMQMH